ncbi:MAG: glycosyltransferase [Acidimicrobiales bacterium]
MGERARGSAVSRWAHRVHARWRHDDEAVVVCDSGGHLLEAWEIADQQLTDRSVRWRTSDTDMARSLLAGRRVRFSRRRVRSRDVTGAMGEFVVAFGLLARWRVGLVLSTGSAYAFPWMLAALLTHTKAVYVESAARNTGLSSSGRLIAKMPWVRKVTQAPLEVAGWEQWPSVLDTALDAWEPRPPSPARAGRPPRVFVTVGTFGYPFDRLMRRVRDVVPADWELVVQHGVSQPVPGAENHRTLEYEAVRREMEAASLVISHLGVGTLVTAARVGVPLVAVPRCRSHGEVVDDHQSELLDRVGDRPGVTAIADVDHLTLDVLRAALASAGEIVG